MAEPHVNVVGADGRVRSLPASTAQEALATGYQLASDEQVIQQKLQDKYGGDAWEAFGYGALRGATFTISDYVLGELDPEMKKRLWAYKQLHEGASIGGEIIGEAASLIATPMGRGIGALEKLAATPFKSAAGKAIAGIGVDAALGGATLGAYSMSDQYLADVPISGERLFSAAATGALFTGALSGLLRVPSLAKGFRELREAQMRGELPTSAVLDDLQTQKSFGQKEFEKLIHKHMAAGRWPAHITPEQAWKLTEPGRIANVDNYPRVIRAHAEEINGRMNANAIDFDQWLDAVYAEARKQLPEHTPRQAQDLYGQLKRVRDSLKEEVVQMRADGVSAWGEANFLKKIDAAWDSFDADINPMPKAASEAEAFMLDAKRVQDAHATGILLEGGKQARYWKAISDMDDVARKLKSREAAERLSRITGEMRDGLPGKDFFGEAAETISAAKRIAAEGKEIYSQLRRKNITDPGGVWDKGYKRWMLKDQDGILELHTSETGRALQNWKRFHEDFANFHASPEYKKLGVDSKYAFSAEKLKQASDIAFDAIDEYTPVVRDLHSLREIIGKSREAMYRIALEGGALFQGIKMGSLAAGITTGIPALAGAGGLAAGAVQYGWRITRDPAALLETAARLRAFANKGAKKQAGALNTMERQAVTSGRKIIKPPKKRGGKALLVLPAINKFNEVEYDKTLEGLHASVGQSDKLREELQDATGNNEHLSASIDEAVEVADRAREYIMGLAWARAVGIKPTNMEMAKVFSAIQGIKWPDKIIQRTLSGDITVAEAKAFKAVHPREFQALKRLVVDKLLKLEGEGKTLPYQQRIKLSIVFGIKADRKLSLRYMTELQQDYLKQKAQGNPQAQNRKTAVPELHKLFDETSETISYNSNNESRDAR